MIVPSANIIASILAMVVIIASILVATSAHPVKLVTGWWG